MYAGRGRKASGMINWNEQALSIVEKGGGENKYLGTPCISGTECPIPH